VPAPPVEPLAVRRVYVDNYVSVGKARADLGDEPMVPTERAVKESLPYYQDLVAAMPADQRREPSTT
jgi:3beta-hydroxy-Delta5-steroid dehydrogenase / steroid Delta-isomerase